MGKRRRKQRKAAYRAVRELTTFLLGVVTEYVTERFGKSRDSKHDQNGRPRQLRSESSS
jgi:hypothetical protein